MKAHLVLEIECDERNAPEGVAIALDILLETAMSTPGVLDNVGNPTVGTFRVLPDEMMRDIAEKLEEDEPLPSIVTGAVALLRNAIGDADLCDKCGKPRRHFMHNCPCSHNMPEMYGCPECDDDCPFCKEQ